MTKGEQARLMTWRLKVLQQAADLGNVARVCRWFGISRKSFYKWKQRHAEHGDAGLCDRRRTPRRFPRATPREVISKILYLRQHYHFGPGRIAVYVKRLWPSLPPSRPTARCLGSRHVCEHARWDRVILRSDLKTTRSHCSSRSTIPPHRPCKCSCRHPSR